MPYDYQNLYLHHHTISSSGQEGPGLKPDLRQILTGPTSPSGMAKSEGGKASRICERITFIKGMVSPLPPAIKRKEY
jgi:hypothetical protein